MRLRLPTHHRSEAERYYQLLAKAAPNLGTGHYNLGLARLHLGLAISLFSFSLNCPNTNINSNPPWCLGHRGKDTHQRTMSPPGQAESADAELGQAVRAWRQAAERRQRQPLEKQALQRIQKRCKKGTGADDSERRRLCDTYAELETFLASR